MAKVKCELCGVKFDRDAAVERFDEEYGGDGSYEYNFQWNNFCYDCAVSVYEEDDDSEPPNGCRECGGDWPNCTTSCPLYDD